MEKNNVFLFLSAHQTVIGFPVAQIKMMCLFIEPGGRFHLKNPIH